MEWVMNNWADVSSLVLAVLGVFSIIAKLTPTKADNAILDALYRVINLVGLTKK